MPRARLVAPWDRAHVHASSPLVHGCVDDVTTTVHLLRLPFVSRAEHRQVGGMTQMETRRRHKDQHEHADEPMGFAHDLGMLNWVQMSSR